MQKLIITIALLSIATQASAQLHYPEYTEAQVAAATDKLCRALNNGKLKTRFEATLMAQLSGSMHRDIRGRENEYSSIEDNQQAVRNTARIVERLNRTCSMVFAD